MRKSEIEKKNAYFHILSTVESVIAENQLIQDGDKIVVAVSGGPDSMCLLNTLNDLKDIFEQKYQIHYTLIVAHVNHMIRKESDEEKIYVENFCQKIHVPFHYLKENVPQNAKLHKMSEETYGRKIRYDFFEKVRQEENASKIAVAHNLDDNVETILLNMIRGCGLNGLTGMNYTFDAIIRPLLDIEKKEILEYNELQNLHPCFDITNEQTIYIRNKVRNLLIPELKKNYNVNFLQNITRMRKILNLDEEFLEDYTSTIVKESILSTTNDQIKFDYQKMLTQHIAIRQRFIRGVIKLKIKNLDGIESIHIMDILKILENNIKGKKYIIGNKFTIEVVKKYTAVIY